MSGEFRIGTSNIVIPGSKKSFPQAFQTRSRLHYYSSLFNSLEVNSSFYKVPMPATFRKWAEDVPEHFRFSIKLSKTITHVKALNFNPEDIKNFMVTANELNDKKGCLLIQFPGSITYDYRKQVRQIIQLTKKSDQKNSWRLALEFRNDSWYNKKTYAMLDEFGATLVLHDIPKSMVTTLHTQSQFVFLRFHGVLGDYRGSYPDDLLKKHALQIKKYLDSGKDVFAYFNNTIGEAFNNAQTLRNFVCE